MGLSPQPSPPVDFSKKKKSLVSLTPPELLEPTRLQGDMSCCSGEVFTALFGDSIIAKAAAGATLSEEMAQSAIKKGVEAVSNQEKLAFALILALASPFACLPRE